MNPAAEIPADIFLDQAIAALTATDAPALRGLEAALPTIAAPRNRELFIARHALFAVLLESTARNLRLLRRVAGQHAHALHPSAGL